MVSGIDMHISQCFPFKGFFILICVIALMVPVSAGQPYPIDPTDTGSLTLLDNSSVSVSGSPANPGGILSGGRNADKKEPGVIVVPVKKEQNTPSHHTIGNVQIMKGTLQKTQKSTELSPDTANNLPAIEILDQNDTVLYSKKFGYQNLLTVPMKMPGQAQDQVPPLISITPETTVVLPYIDGGRKIRIVDEYGQAGDVIVLEETQITDQVTETLDQLTAPPPADPGTFNVLIVASGYSAASISSFNTKASLVKQQLLNAVPFNSYSPAMAVNIYPDTLDLGCYAGCSGIARLMCCDSSKVMSAAEDSGSLYDEIIVIANIATYAGGGYRDGGTTAYKTNSYSSYCQVYDGSYTVPMALHEFGHSFGDLCDEYSYGSEGYSYYPCVNCRASCSDWSAYSGTCTQGCDARSDFFRPERSIMLDLSSPTIFNQASIKADYSPDGLEKRLDFFMPASPALPVAAFTGTPLSGTAPLDVTFTDSSTGTSITNRRWDFGDGNISNYAVSTNPNHRYSSAGTYTVNLTVTNAGGSNSQLRSNYISVSSPPAAPVAAFTGTPLTGTAPLDVTFTDSSTGTSITNRRWDFGDGNISNYAVSTNPNHRYASAGTYTVNLTVTNAGGSNSLKRTNYVSASAPPAAPTASFTGTPLTGTAPLDVTFTDSSTGTSITNRRWDFGDGNISNYAVSTNPNHRYASASTYTVNLTVTNAGGSNSLKRTNYITTTSPLAPPVASFTGTPLSGTAPLDVTFTDSSTGTSITNRRWDFGDGNISNYAVSTNPLHRYASAGTYTINLTVTNAGGSNSLKRTNYITVTSIVVTSPTTQIGVFRPATGTWYLNYNKNEEVDTQFQFGKSGDNPVTGDWNGDGTTDTGVFRPSTGIWYLDTTQTGVVDTTFQFGKSGDIPVVGDWNGDGTDDAGVFRSTNGKWYIDTSNTGVVAVTFHFGKSGDIPVTGDWNGDGTIDAGVFRPSTGTWYLDTTKTGVVNTSFQFGKSGDIPVVGDWNGDGTSDAGAFRPSTGTWYLDTTQTGVVDTLFQFGKSEDIPVTGDWNGDGTDDTGVFRPSSGNWYLDTTQTGVADNAFHFGQSGDSPEVGIWN